MGWGKFIGTAGLFGAYHSAMESYYSGSEPYYSYQPELTVPQTVCYARRSFV